MVQSFMSFNGSVPIDLPTALFLADKIISQKSPKANFLLNLGVRKPRGQYLKLCFSYLRWVDDIVDNPKVIVKDKRKFINRQLNLTSNFASSISEDFEHTEEAFLYYFIQYGLKVKNSTMINSVRLMLEGLEMDVQRTERDGIFSELEMNTYINKMSKSFFDVTASFILPESKYPYQTVIITTASTRIWMVRDLLEDFESGYINIARESLKHLNINVKNLLQGDNLKNYLDSEIANIISILIDEAKIIKQFPLRLKLFNYYTQIYYLPKIFRVKAYSYDLNRIREKRIFLNDLNTYLSSIKLSVVLFFIEFF